jgi:hypothetical protein
MSEKLTDASEILLRQIHPKFIENGEPSSDRFRPSENDANMLSLDRAALVTPADSHLNYVEAGRASAAVFGLSVSEFQSEKVTCVEDPIEATGSTSANPAHSLADYSAHQLKQQKIIGKKLKRVAIARGRLHP